MTGASNPPLSSWLGEGGHEVAASAGVVVVATDATESANPEAMSAAAVRNRSAFDQRRGGVRIRKDYGSAAGPTVAVP